jgi:pimeloyl-ACP methyl ester carboxylesterase
VVRAAVAGTLAVSLLAACEGSSADSAAVPPRNEPSAVEPDEVIDVLVGGRRFATRCAGDTGAPPVMLVSGVGRAMDRSWRSVQPRIGAFARVCAYDRLGVGRSARPNRPQTFADMASDLRVVVDEVFLDPPVVVVAHALGGMVAAELAAEFPASVASLLLLDAPGPGYPQRLLQRLPRRDGAAGARLRAEWEDLLDPADNPERLDGRAAFAAIDALPPLDNVPLVALTHSISRPGGALRPRQAADLESAWEAGQNRWLALSPRARLERVDLAGHLIQDDQPDVVVERVRELVDDRPSR